MAGIGSGLARELIERVDAVAGELRGRDLAWSVAAPAPGKWTPRQLVGHLIDSAVINCQRFGHAGTTDDLVCTPYDQDVWVAARGYADRDFRSLVDLWSALNRHIAAGLERTPDEVFVLPRSRHNLDRVAWEAVAQDEPVTLEYFVRDYLLHLQHHLHALDPDLCAKPGRQRTR